MSQWKHQENAFNFAVDRPASMLALAMGCVDCETEFLSPAGWKRIDQWDGEQVAQFDPDTREMTFVTPLEYINKPSSGMLHFKHARGLNQVLSPDHRVLWYDHRKRPRISPAKQIAMRGIGTTAAKFYAAFRYFGGEGLPLNEFELRLVVAVTADGHYPCKSSRCVLRIKKERKIKRLRELLKLNRIDDFHLRVEDDGFHCFAFEVPMRCKEFGGEFWEASFTQRCVIADEAPHWDGSHTKSGAVEFFSTSKESADFIQFCYASTGRRCSLATNKREGRKSTDYIVHAIGDGRSTNYVNFAMHNGNSSKVESPDGRQYCFEVPTGCLVLRRGGDIFTTGNTGKSKVAVDLSTHWDTQRTLVLCPVSVRAVWRREFLKWDGGRCRVLVLDQKSMNAAKKAEIASQAYSEEGPFVLVVNYETARCPNFASWLVTKTWDLIVADESHRVKAHNTSISKLMLKLAGKSKRRLCLTGTPMPHSPLDVFGQYRFLDHRIFGRRWTPFKHQFAVMGNPVVPQMITAFRNLDILQERFGELAFQVSNDVLDLPPAMHHTRTFKLEGKAQKLYKDIELDFCAELQGGFVTAANALVKAIRLRQLVSGFLKPDDADKSEHIHSGKMDLLSDLLQDIGAPTVVFAEFTHDLNCVRRACDKLKLRYGEISGKRKDGLTEHGTMNEDIDVVGVQYQSGGVGIDLTRASYAIYYSPTYNLGNYDQSLARLHRPGQSRTVQFYHLIAEDTIDEDVYKALSEKRDVIESVLLGLRLRQEEMTCSSR